MNIPLGPLLGKTWDVFAAQWRPIVAILLIVYVPLNAYMAFFAPLPIEGDFIESLGLMRIASLYELLVGTFALILIASLVRLAGEGKSVSLAILWGEQLTGRRYLRVMGTQIIKGVLLFFLFLLLIVPGIVFTVVWACAEMVVLFESVEGMAALRRSRDLVRGRWWNVLWLILGGFLATIGVMEFGASIMEAAFSSEGASFAASILSDVGRGLYIVFMVFVYEALRKDQIPST